MHSWLPIYVEIPAEHPVQCMQITHSLKLPTIAKQHAAILRADKQSTPRALGAYDNMPIQMP